MTKIVTTFNNGFQKEYKGKRDVKAAWMIINKNTGEAYECGHSVDAVNADKTATASSRDVVSASSVCNRPTNNAAQNSFWNEAALKQGYVNWRDMYAQESAVYSEWFNNTIAIEVVTL